MTTNNYSNRNRGSVLILTCILITLIAVGLVVGMSFAGLYLMRGLLQSEANEIALAAAQALNADDREGRMNNMISGNRQLVVASRKSHSWTRDYADYEPLSRELLEEAKRSAQLLEGERVKLAHVAEGEAEDKAEETYEKLKNRTRLVLPWLQTGSAEKLGKIRLGYIQGVQSNVQLPETLFELKKHDQERSYVRPNSGLYLGNISPRLPGEDAHLPYNLSSLAAPVERYASPARITLPSEYRDLPGDHLPSAVFVELGLPVATKVGAQTQSKIKTVASAATYGAMPPIVGHLAAAALERFEQ